jgi:hypothetical protein
MKTNKILTVITISSAIALSATLHGAGKGPPRPQPGPSPTSPKIVVNCVESYAFDPNGGMSQV